MNHNHTFITKICAPKWTKLVLRKAMNLKKINLDYLEFYYTTHNDTMHYCATSRLCHRHQAGVSVSYVELKISVQPAEPG